MCKNLYICLLLIFCCALGYGQQILPLDEKSYLKEINQQIQTAKSEKLRLENYLLLSEFYAPTDSLRSKEALEKVLTSSQSKQFNKGVLDYYQGVYYSNQGKKRKAKEYFGSAVKELAEDSANKELYIKSWYNYGYVQVEEKGYQFLIKTLTEQCIPLSESSKDELMLAYSYTQMGLTFMSVGETDKAQKYHFKSLDILDKLPQEGTIHLITYCNLVSNYCYKAKGDSAKIYLDKAAALLRPYPDSRQFPNYFYQQAMYYTTKQVYPAALEALRKGIESASLHGQTLLKQMMYFRMYNVYLMQKDYTAAKAVLEQILADKILGKEANNRKITFTQLAAVNEVMGDYKEAYQWMKKASALSDSLQQQKLVEKMHELEVTHDTHQKEQTIDQLVREKKVEAQLTKERNIRMLFLLVALILTAIIAGLIWLNYRNQQRLNKQICNSHQQELQHLENEKLYAASKAVLLGEEQERQRIAQDLHDSMGGMLANIRLSISALKMDDNQVVLQKIDKSISEMRRISRNLMPETLKNLGLEIALKELCESMSNAHFVVQFEAFNLKTDIPFPTQLSLYRITQEGLSNVIKYAQATNVIVQISQHEQFLSLTIEDNGVGFNPQEVVYGLGIRNIENRVQLISGSLEVIAQKGQGTTLNIGCNV